MLPKEMFCIQILRITRGSRLHDRIALQMRALIRLGVLSQIQNIKHLIPIKHTE